jgi:hypothetical protein
MFKSSGVKNQTFNYPKADASEHGERPETLKPGQNFKKFLLGGYPSKD